MLQVESQRQLEIQRLLDKIYHAEEDARLLGYAKQIRALLRGEVYR
jgi:hypothetical protein